MENFNKQMENLNAGTNKGHPLNRLRSERGDGQSEKGVVSQAGGRARGEAGTEEGEVQEEGGETRGDVLSEHAVDTLEELLVECEKSERAMEQLLGDVVTARVSLVRSSPSLCLLSLRERQPPPFLPPSPPSFHLPSPHPSIHPSSFVFTPN